MFLDATSISEEKLRERFPTISSMCAKFNIDISKQPIPIAPAAHYMMGGIKTNIEGVTSVSGLYAIGETACTSLHGANRLASNSLLECVVCAYELSNYLSFSNLTVSDKLDETMRATIQKYEQEEAVVVCDVENMKKHLKRVMWENVGIYRSKESLQLARTEIKKMKRDLPIDKRLNNKDEYELRNMLIVAELMAEFALQREESRGAHYRVDYPQTMSEAHHSYASIKEPLIFDANTLEGKSVPV